jgi:hypothetical protein
MNVLNKYNYFFVFMLICLITYSFSAFASWTVQQHTATTGYYTKSSLIVFIISFNPIARCKLYEAGLAVMDGNSYGNPIKQKKSDLPMTLNIDGKRYGYTGYITKYDNGLEKTIPITNTVLNNLKSGNELSIKLDYKTPELTFSLKNSENAINQAYRNCLNSL